MASRWDGKQWVNDFLPPYGRVSSSPKKKRKPKRKITTTRKKSAPKKRMAKAKSKKPAPKEEFEDFRARMLLMCVQDPPEPAPKLLIPIVPSDALTIKAVTLYYTKHSENSDKVYKLSIEKEPKYKDAYYVKFAYGKRGKTLKDGLKTKIAVTLMEAQRIYATFYDEKKSEGYTENVSGVPYSK